MDYVYDIFVVGGGINGCCVARDAAGRGYSVCLAEKNDLASGTSSASTKLIHGGLRYLEHWEFRLVRKALREREVLWRIAPHIISPLRFALPHHRGLRPAWILRLGLFLYDHLGGRKLLPPARTVDLRKDATGEPLQSQFTTGFEYSDCWVDDARLVVLNAVDAQKRGATIRTQTRVTKTEQDGNAWTIHLRDSKTGEVTCVRARVVVNATGPWVDRFLQTSGGQSVERNVRLVRGSHIVVKKIFNHKRCYILQNVDGRIIFAIPYENDFTLIGTTDMDFTGDPDDASVTTAEIDYLCNAASRYFRQPIVPDQVVWQFTGVRPLYNDGATAAQEATRDYVLRIENHGDGCGLVNVFGGKITTCRRLAEAVLEKIETILAPRGGAWTDTVPLPGGDFAVDFFNFSGSFNPLNDLTEKISCSFPFLEPAYITRLTRLYGTDAQRILDGVQSSQDLGIHFGADLYSVEVNHLIDNEFALCADDILYRRTKLGLFFNEGEVAHLQRFMDQRTG